MNQLSERTFKYKGSTHMERRKSINTDDIFEDDLFTKYGSNTINQESPSKASNDTEFIVKKAEKIQIYNEGKIVASYPINKMS